MPPPTTSNRDPVYFVQGYYALLTHQQNMLSDHVRTSAYHQAITNNASLFHNMNVMDLGAGSGILSYFAVLAGARHVWAVEASNMARRIRSFMDKTSSSNRALEGRISVIQSKIEDITDPALIPKVDILISEPVGVLLFHERMLESFIYSRDHYLKPGGTIFPSRASIFLVPFTDAFLFTETMNKARFWQTPDFHGVDLSPLFHEACIESFSLPVVGHFNPNSILSEKNHLQPSLLWDFSSIQLEELYDVLMPFHWTIKYTGLLHGVGGWFDLIFSPSASQAGPDSIEVVMTTAPFATTTHWQQIRFLFTEPLAVNAGDQVKGWIRGTVNSMRSYTMVGEIVICPITPSDPYNEHVTRVLNSLPDECTDWISAGRQNHARRGRWMLNEQTYSYAYQHQPDNPATFIPEHSCLYKPME